MLKTDFGTQTEEQSQSSDPKTQDFQSEILSLRRKLERAQERNKRSAEEKSEWVQQRAKLCYRIDRLQCDLNKQFKLMKSKEELQKAKSGAIRDETVMQIEAAILDKQNHVLQQNYLQARVTQLEQQLLQKDKELQDIKEKQANVKLNKEENENKWNFFKFIFRKRETSSQDMPVKKGDLCPLLRLLRSWTRSSMSEELI
ncbi:interaptin-like [Takifugu rubripes]|uniref:interaptin-like n=1 Tax=Takifugu rubripes TaxID=31033 RepID=UPI001145A7B4|nr:interaptin-like [Takifugu rubripes]